MGHDHLVEAGQNHLKGLLDALIKDLEAAVPQDSLLAHYTSVAALEQIVTGREFHFSHPMFMNDSEELQFGMRAGRDLVQDSEILIQELGVDAAEEFRSFFQESYDDFDSEHAPNVFIACFSLHSPQDVDGSLPMWRGYGTNGDGVAMVVRSASLATEEQGSPLLMLKVAYLPKEKRQEIIAGTIRSTANWVKQNGAAFQRAATNLMWWLKVFSLITKHPGFRDERECRIIYFSELDRAGKYRPSIDYRMSENVVRPILRFRLGDPAQAAPRPIALTECVDRIILGPRTTSATAFAAITHMLRRRCPELVERVSASQIPYRPWTPTG